MRVPRHAYSEGSGAFEVYASSDIGLDWGIYEYKYVCIVESPLGDHGALPIYQDIKVMESSCSAESNGMKKL